MHFMQHQQVNKQTDNGYIFIAKRLQLNVIKEQLSWRCQYFSVKISFRCSFSWFNRSLNLQILVGQIDVERHVDEPVHENFTTLRVTAQMGGWGPVRGGPMSPSSRECLKLPTKLDDSWDYQSFISSINRSTYRSENRNYENKTPQIFLW